MGNAGKPRSRTRLALLGLLLAGPAWGEALRTDWQAEVAAGDRAYLEGRPEAAARHYGRALPAGPASPDLLLALGTSLLKAGRLGPAVASLLEASLRAPGDDEIGTNLAAARAQVARRRGAAGPGLAADTEGQTLRRLLGAPLAFSALALGWLGLGLAWAGRRRRWARRAGWSLALLAAVGAGALAWRTQVLDRRSCAVILADHTPLRRGPDPGYAAAAHLFEGEELLLAGDRGPWLQARRADGLSGWIRRDAAALVPGYRPRDLTASPGRPPPLTPPSPSASGSRQ